MNRDRARTIFDNALYELEWAARRARRGGNDQAAKKMKHAAADLRRLKRAVLGERGPWFEKETRG